MTYDISALDRLLATKLDRERRLEDQLASVRIEIRVLQEAVALMRGAGPEPASRPGTSDKRERQLKPIWARVLRHSAQRRSLDDVMEFAAREGMPIQRNTLRSQFSIYAERGWLERVSDGVYRLTAAGAEKCGYSGEIEQGGAEGKGGATEDDEPPPLGANGSVVGEGEDAQTSVPSLWSHP